MKRQYDVNSFLGKAERSLYCRKVFFDDNLYYDVGFYVEMQMISYMRKLYKVWGV